MENARVILFEDDQDIINLVAMTLQQGHHTLDGVARTRNTGLQIVQAIREGNLVADVAIIDGRLAKRSSQDWYRNTNGVIVKVENDLSQTPNALTSPADLSDAHVIVDELTDVPGILIKKIGFSSLSMYNDFNPPVAVDVDLGKNPYLLLSTIQEF